MNELEADHQRRLHQARQSLREVIRDGKLRSDGKNRFRFNADQRNQEARQDQNRTHGKLLTTHDIEKVQRKLDIGEVLKLTYGNQGASIDLTAVNLNTFRQNIELLQGLYEKGITAKQVIDASLAVDIARANRQIKMAIPLSQKHGVVHFLTDASGENGAVNHHVHVEFLAFKSLSSALDVTDKTAKNLLNFGKLKFECDCGRHDFWYRYIASVGGYGYGRQENAYPKIRNPSLTGLACKHVIRVMDYIRSPAGIRYMWQQLEKTKRARTDRRQHQTDRQLEQDIANSMPRMITGNPDAALRTMDRQANRIAKQYFEQQRKQWKALKKDLNALARLQEKQLNERRQAIARSLTEHEAAQVEALLKKLRGH